MRTIKFRAKCLDGSGWVSGDLHLHTCTPHIHPHEGPLTNRERKFIIPATIGQFTGLHDKNGREIYEGDVCATEFGEGYFVNMSVVWFERGGYWAIQEIDGDDTMHFVADYFNYIEVIGNIHDNPELLNK